MHIFIDYPWYCLPLCVLAGAVYSAAMYLSRRKETVVAEDKVAKGWIWLLAAARFLIVTILAFLLLGPVLRHTVNRHEKPVVAVIRDVSRSVPTTQRTLPEGLTELEKEYEVVYDSFGGGSTDIASALDAVRQQYAGRNLGAVVLMSDGIYNQGANPATEAMQLGVPIYTIALGDTTRRPDAWIADVRCNRVVYTGSQFPMEVTVRATRLNGAKATLTISSGGRQLATQPLTYDGNSYSQTVPLMLDAKESGLHSYSVTVSAVKGETSTANNSRTVAVEVLEGRRKVAIVAAAPHPDIAALKQAIETNPNYEVEVYSTLQAAMNAEKSVWDTYSTLVLHNLPAPGNTTAQWLQTLPSTLPRVYVVGMATDLGRFNALHCGIEVTAKSRHADEVTAILDETFTLFAFDRETATRIAALPPLQAPFGNYRMAPGMQCLFRAKLSGKPTDRPMMAFGVQNGTRCACVLGEGLWRWKLHSYLMTGSHDDFDQTIEKIVVYAGAEAGKERLHVMSERYYREDEAIVIRAEFYDDNWQLTNRPEVECQITPKGGGESTRYEFQPSGQGYTLPLGTLAPGQYSYQAKTTFAGKQYKATGGFIVEALDLEQLNLVADHALLNTMAQTTGGAMVPYDQTDKLASLLGEREDLKTVIYSHTEYTPMISLPWVLILLILLLTIEWAGRRLARFTS